MAIARLSLDVSPNRDHLLGPAQAPVTLLEYGDYECPHCGRAYPIIQELLGHFPNQLRLAFRNFPLSESHPHALNAAQAAEAASAQGKFWEMHDTLFANQDALAMEDLRAYAAELDLDLHRFDRELQEEIYLPRIKEDYESGLHSSVQGTPTFFINSLHYQGSYDLHSLSNAIAAALNLQS